MNETDVEAQRRSPTSPEAATALLEVSQAAESYGEPSGTLAEARRQGADMWDEEPELETVVERHARLEEARDTMWRATTHNTGGALIGTGAQEEETARIGDHLVFPGTGIRELREQGRLEEAAELAAADRETPTHNPDRFPPAEWPPAEQRGQDDGGASSGAEQRPEDLPTGLPATSKRALTQPWALAGACLGAGLVSGLILRAAMDRMAQRDASGGSTTGKETADGRAGRMAEAVKSKAEDVKAAALAKAGDVKEAAKSKAGDVKTAAGGKVEDVKVAARGRVAGVKAAAKSAAAEQKPIKAKAGEAKESVKARAGEAKASVKGKAGQGKGKEPAGTRVARAGPTPSKTNGSQPSASGGRTKA